MSQDQKIDFDAQRFLQVLEKVQSNKGIFKDKTRFEELGKLISVANDLQNKVREYKTKQFPKQVDIHELRVQFMNQPNYKLLYEKKPGLFFTALEEKLDNGETGKIIQQISKANEDPEKVGENLGNYVEGIKDTFVTNIKNFEEKEKKKNEKVKEISEDENDVIEEEENDEENIEEDNYNKVLKERANQEQDEIQKLIQLYESDRNKN